MLAGTGSGDAGIELAGKQHNGADQIFNLLLSDRAGAEDGEWLGGEVEDGGFDADGAGAAIEDEIDGIAKFIADMLGAGGADAGGAIGAGGGEGAVEFF